MYAIVYRSAYRGGWKLKLKVYKTREAATKDGARIAARDGGEFRVVYFDWE